jgi:hypothetical protein
MTYLQIYTAVQALRFDASILTTDGGIKQWIRAREGEIWQYADWPQKESVEINLTVSNGVATAPLPAGFLATAQLLTIKDEFGAELEFLPPARFYEIYQPLIVPAVVTGLGEAWTLTTDPVGGTLQIRIGPTPQGAKTYTVRGWTLPIKRTAATTWAIGTMSADADLPWWPDDYHYFLVDGALATGKRQLGDPSWAQDESAFQQGLSRLAHELMPARGVEIWGEC